MYTPAGSNLNKWNTTLSTNTVFICWENLELHFIHTLFCSWVGLNPDIKFLFSAVSCTSEVNNVKRKTIWLWKDVESDWPAYTDYTITHTISHLFMQQDMIKQIASCIIRVSDIANHSFKLPHMYCFNDHFVNYSPWIMPLSYYHSYKSSSFHDLN